MNAEFVGKVKAIEAHREINACRVFADVNGSTVNGITILHGPEVFAVALENKITRP